MTLLILAAVLCVCATAILYLSKKERNHTYKNIAQNGVGTTQSLVQIADFEGMCAVRRDGARVVFIGVEGRSIEFLAQQDREVAVTDLEEVFAATDYPFTIHRITRPVDSAEVLKRTKMQIDEVCEQEQEVMEQARQMRAKKGKNASFPLTRRAMALDCRRQLLEEVYKARAQKRIEAYEISAYITMSFQKEAPHETLCRASESLMQRLENAGFVTHIMTPSEIMRAITNYYGRFECKAQEQQY